MPDAGRPTPLRPPALGPGATVALVAPSRPGDPGRLAAATAWLESRDLRVVRAGDPERRYHYLAGRDGERADAVMAAFLDDEVDALLCVRGGFGACRILDRLDYEAIAARPKPVIGFSDSTGLHLALHGRTGLVGFSGALADTDLARTPPEPLVVDSLWSLLTGGDAGPVAAAGDLHVLRPGRAEGPLVPANLALLCSLLGTPYLPAWDGVILLLEDVGEAPYRIDRMLTQLRLAGLFDRIAGLALGTFADCFVPTEMDPSPTLHEIVDDALGNRCLPVVGGFAYGHTRRRCVLPVGVPARLNTDGPELRLLTPAVVPPDAGTDCRDRPRRPT